MFAHTNVFSRMGIRVLSFFAARGHAIPSQPRFLMQSHNLNSQKENATEAFILNAPYSAPYKVERQFPQIIRAWGNVPRPDAHQNIYIIPNGETQFAGNGGSYFGALYKHTLPNDMEWIAFHGTYLFIDD